MIDDNALMNIRDDSQQLLFYRDAHVPGYEPMPMIEMDYPLDVLALTKAIQDYMPKCAVWVSVSGAPIGYVVTITPDDNAYFYKFYAELPTIDEVCLDFGAKVVANHIDQSIIDSYKNEFL